MILPTMSCQKCSLLSPSLVPAIFLFLLPMEMLYQQLVLLTICKQTTPLCEVCMIIYLPFFSFGSLICSKKSGIIFNDEMDDFGTPSKVCSTCLPPNYIQPGKRPQSSMSPTIMLDKDGKVKMVIGASGGSMIPSGVLQVRPVCGVSLPHCSVPCRLYWMSCGSTRHSLMPLPIQGCITSSSLIMLQWNQTFPLNTSKH